MPLSGVTAEAARRFATLNSFVGWLEGEETKHVPPNPPMPIYVKACKGLVFVHLYAVWEYTLNSIGIAANQFVNAQRIRKADMAVSLLPLVVSNQLASLRDCKVGDTWRKSMDMFGEAFSTDIAEIRDTTFPKDGSHYRFQQMETLCQHLCVTASPDTKPSARWIVNETVDNRNNIAHGSVVPEDVGGRYSMSEIKRRVTGLDKLIAHAANVITHQLTTQNGLTR